MVMPAAPLPMMQISHDSMSVGPRSLISEIIICLSSKPSWLIRVFGDGFDGAIRPAGDQNLAGLDSNSGFQGRAVLFSQGDGIAALEDLFGADGAEVIFHGVEAGALF